MFEPGIKLRPVYFHFDLLFSVSILFRHALTLVRGKLKVKNKGENDEETLLFSGKRSTESKRRILVTSKS